MRQGFCAGLVKARTAIGLIYLVAILAAVGVIQFTGFLHPVVSTFTGLVAATLVIYLSSRLSRNASVFDPFWSVAPLGVTIFWLFSQVGPGHLEARHVLVTLIVAAWSVRLTLNWVTGWKGFEHEDWRYTYLRQKSGRYFWLVDLAGIEMMPMVLVYLGTLCVYPVMSSGGHLNLLDGVGTVIAAGAIGIEGLADLQLRSFLHRAGRLEVMYKGLWAVSRHPNYLGEILFWWGLFAFTMACAPGYWWVVIGPVSVTLLFVGVSIPLMEQRNLSRKRGYSEYQNEVPVLLPRPEAVRSGILRLTKLR